MQIQQHKQHLSIKRIITVQRTVFETYCSIISGRCSFSVVQDALSTHCSKNGVTITSDHLKIWSEPSDLNASLVHSHVYCTPLVIGLPKIHVKHV